MFEIFFIVFFSTCILTYLYKIVWSNVFYIQKTPTGFGIFLILTLLLYTLILDGIQDNFYFLSLISAFSLVYWLDDYLHLTSIFRFLIQFVSGFLLAYLCLFLGELNFGIYKYPICIFFGLSSIFFSNIINFYDGLDLNISTLILLFSFILIFFINVKEINFLYGIIIASFILGFSIFNIIPNNIFFGDSGCFAFGSFINLILIQSFIEQDLTSFIFLFVPIALPIIDVLYVIFLRIQLKEALLTRNYHHLYHRVENRFKNKMYLIPQFLNIILLLILSSFIPFYNITYVSIFIVSATVITLLDYFLIRKYMS